MKYHSRFPVEIKNAFTDIIEDAEAFFFYHCGRNGSWDTPEEPPFVDVVDITVGGLSVLQELSESQYRCIEGELLSLMSYKDEE